MERADCRLLKKTDTQLGKRKKKWKMVFYLISVSAFKSLHDDIAQGSTIFSRSKNKPRLASIFLPKIGFY